MSLCNQVLEKDIGHWIDGKEVIVSGEETFENICSYNGKVLNHISLGSKEAVAEAVAASKKALSRSGWTESSVQERAKVVHRIADLIEKNLEELARLESIDTGKPISETRTGDIPRAASNFRFFADACVREQEEIYSGPGDTIHRAFREPLGIVGLITPWNLPLYLESWKIAPALMCGNAIILKPAELTPLSAFALSKITKEAGLPDGLFNVVQGFGANSAGEALVTHPDVAAISFTGETTTGVAIAKASADQLKRLSFELGGKGASVVCASADLERAAETVCRAAFRNQGQICLAGSRLIVHESVKDKFLDLLMNHVQKIKVGDPLQDDTTMGALIGKDHHAKVLSYIEHARGQGFKVLCGGGVPEGLESGAYISPTVIDEVSQESRLIQEEIFGPVLTVQTFQDDHQALEFLNGTKYGLSCSIWSEDDQQLSYLSRNARMGLVWQNSWFLRNLNTPFGGMKKSGVGREGGTHSLDFFSEQKTISSFTQ